MRAFRVLLALGYLAGTAALSFVLWFSGIYGYEEVGGAAVRGSAWYRDVDAWQWDAIFVLGLASPFVGLFALARRSLGALVLHALLSGAGVALVLQAGAVNRGQLALGWLATFAAGAGFIKTRRQ